MLPLDNGSNLRYNDRTQKQITGCKSAVDGLLWEQEDRGSIPLTPIIKPFYENERTERTERT